MGVGERETVGIYVSIPFCRAKCSFCNFASGVFAAERLEGYFDRLCAELRAARVWAERLGAELPGRVDSIYLGGGTPSLLEPELVRRVFGAIHGEFEVDEGAELTVECAPGQMSDRTLEALQREGVDRLSFGVQSFVDRECAAVGRLHTGAECRTELSRMQRAGVGRLALDLIVGLPHQTEASWRYTIEEAVSTGVEHVSVYMLEVDEDSRLGREAMAGGVRYGAGELPDEDRTADWYEAGCGWLGAAGLRQYEISNFALAAGESRHNRKYWERRPYVGLGLDAHSMLRAGGGTGAVRWANGDDLDGYVGGALVQLGGGAEYERKVDRVGQREAFEEAFFLGLRLVEGVDLKGLREEFGRELMAEVADAMEEVESAGLIERVEGRMRLTGRGRMISNEVFSRLLLEPVA